MRRIERKIEDKGEILTIFEKCKVLRIALCDGGMPYIVPMNFGYEKVLDDIFIYLHCAAVGKKIDIIRKNNNVCFEADIPIEIQKGEIACAWTQKYESVIGFGKIYFIENIIEKIKGLNFMMAKYGFKGKPEYSEKMLEKVQVLKIKVDSISGKVNL